MEQSSTEALKNFEAEKSDLESKIRNKPWINWPRRIRISIATKRNWQAMNKRQTKLSIKLQQLMRNDIISPNTGWVQSIIGQVGRTVSSGEALFEIIPDTEDLWVELSVRGMDQPLIHMVTRSGSNSRVGLPSSSSGGPA
jgi:multidrug resistance efflux pump